jgi:hypothetical protein
MIPELKLYKGSSGLIPSFFVIVQNLMDKFK